MQEDIMNLIMRHVTLLDSSIKSSVDSLRYIEENNLNAVIDECENREKIINIIGKFQGQVEDYLSQLKPDEINDDVIAIAKSWNGDIQRWVSRTEQIDQIVSSFLEGKREESLEEIATIFKNKEKFKGYNLNNVKK